jgi:hypothetical protein
MLRLMSEVNQEVPEKTSSREATYWLISFTPLFLGRLLQYTIWGPPVTAVMSSAMILNRAD